MPHVLNPVRGAHAMAVATHALASQSALAVMREGGNAVEAMIAAASTIAVVYPHMNSLGGDGFWLIAKPGEPPLALDACGRAAQGASLASYREQGLDSIPFRGGLAANTVAGTVSGWNAAFEWQHRVLGGRMPLKRLLGDAIDYARQGIPVTASQSRCTASKCDELGTIPGFSQTFLNAGRVPLPGQRFTHSRLADTLERLAQAGLNDFYDGDLAQSICAELEAAGSPLRRVDFQRHRAEWREALVLSHSQGKVYNFPPPTQGLVSLLILGQLDRLLSPEMDASGAPFVHACVEATKRAFAIRDRHITDPDHMTDEAQSFLTHDRLDAMASTFDPHRAAPWGKGVGPADTVWMGVVDREGVAVSFIQSLYHEFGSGIVLPTTGLNWQNRGCSFSLDPTGRNPLTPGRKPFHTLNPAMARLNDGRTLVYGNMGGDGQPQSQSAVFSRIVNFGMNPQSAIDAPRWLLGRTWGNASDNLKLESRFSDACVAELTAKGHDVAVLQDYDESMGHAGAIVRHGDGLLEGGADPRSDGAVAAW
ncbi:gamma-glutamyltransferase family protein [Pseudomonas sp. GD03842]|uniref:gamma-glutamyltransferase family protein n=1 Tax=Pseudomonas sp. GD03842 TaxID=2975385 RepID=UPI00244A97D5|nr:gamma-glutamyltransferase family protein [Pseudomonas sp. GD03842]MDH0745167.1 gamma-glutamyltransferase family protein [Pseudomonas sp. GD03842]